MTVSPTARPAHVVRPEVIYQQEQDVRLSSARCCWLHRRDSEHEAEGHQRCCVAGHPPRPGGVGVAPS